MELKKAGDRENPLCPHCEKELNEIVAKQFDKAWFKVTEKKAPASYAGPSHCCWLR